MTVIGIDAPSVQAASNVLLPEATAKISMRIVPGADADRELEALMGHLRSVAPWNVIVEVENGGSIPLVATLKKAAPSADVLLWGAEDLALSRIHASNESVDPREIEDMVVAQVLTLVGLGETPLAPA